MRPVIVTLSGVSNSAVIPMDIYLNPFSLSIDAQITGAPTYTVEWTQDNIWAVGYDPSTGNWIPVAGMDAAVADAQATFNSPVRAFRVRQTVGAAPNGVEVRFIQGGAE